jgi:hypothetical protein
LYLVLDPKDFYEALHHKVTIEKTFLTLTFMFSTGSNTKGISAGVADPTIFDRIRIITLINLWASFFWKYFWQKYAPKSAFLIKKVKKTAIPTVFMAFTNTKIVDTVSFIKARIWIRMRS